MKKYLTFMTALLFFCVAATAQTQIPNGGFENWSSGNPTGWGSSDKVITQLFQPDPGGVEQETAPANVYAGNSAVRLTNKEVSLPGIGTQVIPGVVNLGDISLNLATFTPEITGLAYTDRPDSITFAAKYTPAPASGDSGVVVVTLTRWTGTDRQIIANTFVQFGNLPSYQVFTSKLRYFSFFNPDTLLIQGISSSSQTAAIDSKLWLDEMSFIGLDTAFKAYINPFQDRDICEGDTLRFRTDDIQGNTYLWYKDGTALNNETTPELLTTTAGDYFVEVVYNGNTYISDTITIAVNPLPVVSFSALPADTLCSQANPLTLSGGSPSGGAYSGNGVDNGVFDPTVAGVGGHDITYTYTDQNGCAASATKNIWIKLCTGIETTEPGVEINIFPNPASNIMTLTSGEVMKGGLVNVFDLNGRLILTERITAAQMPLNVTALPNGTYSVQIIKSNGKPIAKTNISIAR